MGLKWEQGAEPPNPLTLTNEYEYEYLLLLSMQSEKMSVRALALLVMVVLLAVAAVLSTGISKVDLMSYCCKEFDTCKKMGGRPSCRGHRYVCPIPVR